VAQPRTSRDQRRVEELLLEISALLKKQPHLQFALEVSLRREPTRGELAALLKRIPQFCAMGGTREEHFADDLGSLFLNQHRPGSVVVEERQPEGQPKIGLALTQAEAGQPMRHIFVRLVFSDERAEQFLKREAQQLPPSAPGLLMFEMSDATGGSRNWRTLIEGRFKPDVRGRVVYTRVGAVCLFQSAIAPSPLGEVWEAETRVLVNPNAAVALPDWVTETLRRHQRVEITAG
jgi:hypothetical protein